MKTVELFNRKYPLHFHIGYIFILLFIVLSSILVFINYQQTSNLIIKATEELFSEVANDVKVRFERDYKPIAASIRLLSTTAITESRSFDEKIKNLQIIAEVIEEEPQVSGFQLAYDDGSLIIIRPATSDYMKALFNPPASTRFIVDSISKSENNHYYHLRLFFNEHLKTIEVRDPGYIETDPRNRDWYKKAKSNFENQVSSPYPLYLLNRFGITLSRQSHTGVSVLAADIPLDILSETLSSKKITPSTISIIYNDADEILAHNQSNIFDSDDANQDLNKTLTLIDLNNSLISQFLKKESSFNSAIELSENGEEWFGRTQKIKLHDKLELKLLILSPKNELLQEVFAIRNQNITVTLLIVLLSIPIVWWFSNRISWPLKNLAKETNEISKFNFTQSITTDSFITEVHQLANSMSYAKETIRKFLNLTRSIANEQNFEKLAQLVTKESMHTCNADASILYLVSDNEDQLEAHNIQTQDNKYIDKQTINSYSLDSESDEMLKSIFLNKKTDILNLSKKDNGELSEFFNIVNANSLSIITIPLLDRQASTIGLLTLVYAGEKESGKKIDQAIIEFAKSMSGFASVAIENRKLLQKQKALLESFIELIARAIDAKSPYTAGHCQRVPVITKLIASAACETDNGVFKDFNLSDDEWEELSIAAWLHDCGKLTTPEYIVDKATKLEGLNDRIHEIRMRFEVLKRDAEINYWINLAEGKDPTELATTLANEKEQLDEDFYFIAECNIGGELLAPEKLERLEQIGQRTWQRTLSDRVGISWHEKQRKDREPERQLPVEELLLDNKEEHIIHWNESEKITDDNPWGFKLTIPEHKYNLGELHNLSVSRGTLTEEDRFKINDHIMQTIIMLNQLPYPKHLKNVPDIAGGHHEKLDGTGYPKRLKKGDMLLTARMMAIADIFEALTASDRPYKKAKTLSESLQIMNKLKEEQHIDADLFELFLRSGVYKKYAEQYLNEEQIDEINTENYIN